jgi:hypothetical protein
MARTKNTCHIPLIDSLLRNLKNGKKNKTCPIGLLDSLKRNLGNGKNKRRHVICLS